MCFALLPAAGWTQDQIGYRFDVNGQPFHGYYDHFTYSPEKAIQIIHEAQGYERGRYYDLSGKRIEGWMQFKNYRTLYFKEKRKGPSIYLRPTTVQSFVIGVDSFYVAENTRPNVYKFKKAFVQHVCQIGHRTVGRMYFFNSTGRSKYMSITHIVKTDTSNRWTRLHDGSNLEQLATNFFAEHSGDLASSQVGESAPPSPIPHIARKISSMELDRNNIITIIKMAEYDDKFRNDQPILFDQYWREVQQQKSSKYTGRIVEQTDSTWTIEFFEGATKLYQVNYSSIHPFTKEGALTAYWPNGQPRRQIRYVKNKERAITIYDSTGAIQTQYAHRGNHNAPPSMREIKTKYDFVSSGTGQNKADGSKNFVNQIADQETNNIYLTQYKDLEIRKSYALQNGDTIFQLTHPNEKLKLSTLQSNMKFFLENEGYSDAVYAGMQGTLLVNITTNEKGFISDYQLLNSLHPQLDSLINRFFESKISLEGRSPYRFKRISSTRKKRPHEFVLPIVFGTARFQDPSTFNFNNFNLYNSSMQHHLQFQQQQSINRALMGF